MRPSAVNTTDSRRPVPAPQSSDSTPATIAGLQRDLSSARARNATLYRELRRAAAAPTVVAVLPGPHAECSEIVFLSNGIRLERRFDTATGAFRYCQGDDIPTTLAAILDGLFAEPRQAPVGLGEMRREMGVI